MGLQVSAGCKEQFSVGRGRVMEYFRLRRGRWMLALYLYVTIGARKGIRSVQLAREAVITRKSAWLLRQWMGASCAEPRTPMTGEVIAVFRLRRQQRRQRMAEGRAVNKG